MGNLHVLKQRQEKEATPSVYLVATNYHMWSFIYLFIYFFFQFLA